MNIRYRYANDSPKRKVLDRRFCGIAPGFTLPAPERYDGKKVYPTRLLCARVRWQGPKLACEARGFAPKHGTGIGCDSSLARCWKVSVQVMKEQDMPLRDLAEERKAKRRAKNAGGVL